jgi:hypothetical protein
MDGAARDPGAGGSRRARLVTASGSGRGGGGEHDGGGHDLQHAPHCHNFCPNFPSYSSDDDVTVNGMPDERETDQPHEHTPRATYILRQRDGVPYEVERVVCTVCRQVLTERALRRAAA